MQLRYMETVSFLGKSSQKVNYILGFLEKSQQKLSLEKKPAKTLSGKKASKNPQQS